MPVRVKNSKTGSGSGKKPVCMQAPLDRTATGAVMHHIREV
jgi:hypothetical protein